MTLLTSELIMKKDATKKKTGYRIVGKYKHSAVEICRWTKSVLRGGRNCYKGWFGVKSHCCVQMTPCLICNFACQFCWRRFDSRKMKISDWDTPKEIIEEAIKAQKELLSGFGGNPKTTKKVLKEAMRPKHFAISLDGEATLYPYLSELIHEIKSRGCTAFLVTNGTMPNRLKELKEKNSEPTNLYISVYGTSEEDYQNVCNSSIPDAFERVVESLKLMKGFKEARTIFRITAVKNLTMLNPESYSELVRISKPQFIEVKGYAWLGESRQRLSESAVPSMGEIKDFAEKIAELTEYKIRLWDDRSRVLLLSKPEIQVNYDVF